MIIYYHDIHRFLLMEMLKPVFLKVCYINIFPEINHRKGVICTSYEKRPTREVTKINFDKRALVFSSKHQQWLGCEIQIMPIQMFKQNSFENVNQQTANCENNFYHLQTLEVSVTHDLNRNIYQIYLIKHEIYLVKDRLYLVEDKRYLV